MRQTDPFSLLQLNDEHNTNLISSRTRVRVFDPIFEWTFPLFDWPGLVFRDLSDRLNLSRDEGEKWIVNLIRETRMGADAKIDLEKVRRVFSFFSTRNVV